MHYAADTGDLLHMLEQLRSPERSGQIQGWECGGSVFLDFLRIRNNLQELSSSEDEVSGLELESLHVGLKKLAVRLDQLPSDTPSQV